MTDKALKELEPRFQKLYAKTGRPSIATEELLRALLLQALYSVRSVWQRPRLAALHGGWNSTGSMGEREELSAKGC